MKQAIFIITYYGCDGLARRSVHKAFLKEEDRDQYLKDLGSKANYYSTEDIVADLNEVARTAWKSLDGLQKLAIEEFMVAEFI